MEVEEGNNFMKIYLDDMRQAPDKDWTVVRTAREFQDQIKDCVAKNEKIETISFDNDLGEGQAEGYELLKWLVENHPEYVVGETEILTHSANPTARENMEALVKSCREHSEDVLEMKNRKYPFGEKE